VYDIEEAKNIFMEKPIKVIDAYKRIADMARQLKNEDNIFSSQISAEWLYWAMSILEKTKEVNKNL
jgi:hypothetical protein